MDILYLVDRLENLVASSRRMPLVNQIIIKESEILSILELMRTSIPDEVKQARRITQERDRILTQAQSEANELKEQIAEQAQNEADEIVEHAREEAAQLVDKEEIVHIAEERAEQIQRLAQEHAEELVRRAEEHSDYLKNDADAYVAETLRNLREHLTSIETDVSRTILSIEKGLASLTEQQSVDLEDEDVAEEDEFEESASSPTTRRSSLAADTTGGPNYQQ